MLDKLGMGQAKAVVTPGSKEASTAGTTSGEQHLDTHSRFFGSFDGLPVCDRDEVRYDIRNDRSVARRLESNGGE